MHRQIDRRAIGILALTIAVVSVAGPEFVEDDDAGTNSTSAAPVSGFNNVGPVTTISGRLLGAASPAFGDLSDFEDVYLINIVDPKNFSATTNPLVGGFSEFNSALYVFNEDGEPLLGNLETPEEDVDQGKSFGETASGIGWNEAGDAGDLPANAQAVVAAGGGVLTSINGVLDSGVDDEDMYLINISDPESFMASTFSNGGYATFGAELWLFDVNGLGLLGNGAYSFEGNLAAFLSPILGPERLGPQSNDKSGSELTESGLYLLAISYDGNHPFSGSGQAIFNFQSPVEISGPDGAGGGAPVSGWTDQLSVGNGGSDGGIPAVDEYNIALNGVSFLTDGSATVGPASNDGTGILIKEAGLYLLAISSDANRPLNTDGEPLYLFQMPDEISGPDGPGAPDLLDFWDSNFNFVNGEFGTGEYLIILNGVGSVPVLLCGDLDHDGDVDDDDLALMLEAVGSEEGDENYNPEADFDNDGVIGQIDYGIWFQCYLDAND